MTRAQADAASDVIFFITAFITCDRNKMRSIYFKIGTFFGIFVNHQCLFYNEIAVEGSIIKSETYHNVETSIGAFHSYELCKGQGFPRGGCKGLNFTLSNLFFSRPPPIALWKGWRASGGRKFAFLQISEQI